MPLTNDKSQYYADISVQEYECDTTGHIKPGYILRHMQQISAEHLNALNLPYTELLRRGQVFLMNRLLLKINSIPMGGESCRLTTTPKKPEGAQFIRTNEFFREDGQSLMRADTTWLLVNPESRKILRPREFEFPVPFTEDEVPCPLVRYRPEPPKVLCEVGSREVRYSDIDVNRHMNNAAYADIVCDFLPPGEYESAPPESLYISFQNEAVLGDIITVFRGQSKPREWYISGKKGDKPCFEAIIS